MTDKEFNKFDKHYNNLVKKGTIKTMNDACIYKLAIEEAIKVMHSCKSDSELLHTEVFNLANKLAINGYGNEAVKMHGICNGM